jgi:hypothetical protein
MVIFILPGITVDLEIGMVFLTFICGGVGFGFEPFFSPRARAALHGGDRILLFLTFGWHPGRDRKKRNRRKGRWLGPGHSWG